MRAGKKAGLVLAISVAVLAVAYWQHSRHGPASPVWVVDPRERASDLPPAGRSLFDMATIEQHDGRPHYEIPFPFSALLARIQMQTQGKTSIFKPVLIPAGRSLQRSAAAPEFFRFPRVVVAVDTDSGADGAPLFKDRLYLGYQEKAAVIEVISYNETAGRFEFQVVKDYRAGAAPQVAYANRAVCTACHQNAAPIFSLPLWDETQANPLIVAGLKATHRDFYGLSLDAASDVAYAIDNATDRANRYSLYQSLWAACGDASTVQDARRAVLIETLRYGLSTQPVIAAGESRFQAAARGCAAKWQRRWPQGLALPNPNIPNRNPFLQRVGNGVTHPLAALEPRGALSDRKIEAEIAAPFEPLTPRAPLEIWQPGTDKFEQLVRGLSEFFARSDWRFVDRVLRDRGRTLITHTVSALCKHTEESDTAERWICRDAGLDLVLYLDKRVPLNSALSLLRVGDNPALRSLTLASAIPAASGVVLSVAGRDGMAFRLPSAERVTRIAIVDGMAYVTLIDDFGFAIAAVHDSSREAPKILSAPVFRRAELLPALYRKLGIVNVGVCCAIPAMPVPLVTETHDDAAMVSTADTAENTDRTLFRHYCARCHATDERFPPNFLRGDVATVERNLDRCAERIYFRLSMWPLPQSARAKTPMPPTYALSAYGLDEPQWQHHRDLERLRNAARTRLMRESGRTQTPNALLHDDYARLRSCLPENVSVH